MGLKATLQPLVRTGIKTVASAVDRVLPAADGVVVLIYHRIGAGCGGQMDLTPAAFDAQLAWLAANRNVITLDAAADAIERGDGATGRDVVLTFDDGTTDWVEHALPLLERHRLPATFYVATDFIERQVPFPADGPPLSWDGLRELASSELVTIGSHTHTHALLDRLSDAEIDRELDTCGQLLQERLDVDARHFAYPKAVAGNPAAERAVRTRFRTAVLAGTRPNPPGTDLHRLHRSPIQPSDDTVWFERKATGGLHAEDDLRRTINRIRYRGATS